jgi:hypothetical protein
MDDVRTFPGETEAERTSRLQREAELLAEAERDLAEGRFITGAELDEFLKWFVSDDEGEPPGEPEET